MAGKHHVWFTATKTVKAPVPVAFTTKQGEHVGFVAKKPVEAKVPVSFDAKNK